MSELSLPKLEKHCKHDVEIYLRVLEMRQSVGVAEWLRANEWAKENSQRIRVALKEVI